MQTLTTSDYLQTVVNSIQAHGGMCEVYIELKARLAASQRDHAHHDEFLGQDLRVLRAEVAKMKKQAQVDSTHREAAPAWSLEFST